MNTKHATQINLIIVADKIQHIDGQTPFCELVSPNIRGSIHQKIGIKTNFFDTNLY